MKVKKGEREMAMGGNANEGRWKGGKDRGWIWE